MRLSFMQYMLLGMLTVLSGCSTMLEGSQQKIAINSVPEGASCILKSNDEIIAEVNSTPQVVTVQKSKYDIVVECTKAGYLKGKNKNHADYAISGIGNMVFGQFGVIGSMMDSSTGAGNKYDSQVFVELEKAADPVMAQTAPVIAQTPEPASPVFATVPKTISEALSPVAYQPLLIQPLQQVAQVTTEVSAKSVTDGTRQPPYDVTQ